MGNKISANCFVINASVYVNWTCHLAMCFFSTSAISYTSCFKYDQEIVIDFSSEQSNTELYEQNNVKMFQLSK